MSFERIINLSLWVSRVHSKLIYYSQLLITEEDSPTELAKRLESELTGSILALWQQRLTQSTSFEGEIEIEYAESDINSSGPPSPSSDDPSVLPHPDLINHNFGNTDRNGNR